MKLITYGLNALNRAFFSSNQFLFVSLIMICSGPLFAQTVQVGSIPDQFAVDGSGSVNYSVPIQVPPGIGGIAPKLSLNYNSQGGNGVAGVGWSLGGLSMVYRCGRTLDQDGIVDGIDFDGTDAYCFDGQRLIEIGPHSSSYGSGTEYRTELDEFSRVVAYGTQGDGPEFFVVESKSGETLEYGYTASPNDNLVGATTAPASRVELPNSSNVMMWALNKIYDTSGNYYTVAYTEYNAYGIHQVNHIDYTGNGGQAPNNSVRFIYETRPDELIKFFAGKKMRTFDRLAAIQTWTAGLVHEYNLNYEIESSTDRSQLISIQQCTDANGAGDCLQANTFAWLNNVVSTSYQAINYTDGYMQVNADHTTWLPGDFNGDGLTDLARRKKDHTPGMPNNIILFADGQSGWNVVVDTDTVEAATGEDYTWLTGDFNGDGMTDLFLRSDEAGYLRNRILLADGQGGWSILSNKDSYSTASDNEHTWLNGDFNGDGLTDLVRRHKYGTKNDMLLANGQNGWTDINNTDSVLGATGDGDTLWLTGDFNGDGLTDLSRRTKYATGNLIMLSNGQGGWEYIWGSDSVRGINDDDSTWLTGDFNGDGLTDLIRRVNDYNPALGSVNVMMLADGNGGWEIIWDCDQLQGASGTATLWLTGDFNGDGRTDLMRRSEVVQSSAMLISDGLGGWTSIDFYIDGLQGANSDNVNWFAGDVNGDGITDMIRRHKDVIHRNSIRLGSSGMPHAISQFTDGFGVSTDIEYKPLTDDTVYDKTGCTDFGSHEHCAQFPIYAVSQVSKPNGVGGTVSSSYKYYGLKVNHRGRGLLGFHSYEQTNNQTGIRSDTQFHHDFPYTGQVVLTRQVLPSGNYLGGTDYFYATDNPHHPNVHFSYPQQQIDYICDLNNPCPPGQLPTTYLTKVTTDNSFDNYGNPTQVNVFSEGNGEIYKKLTTNTYDNNTIDWWLGRLLSSEVLSYDADNNSLRRYATFQYSGVTGLLTKEVREPDHVDPNIRLTTLYVHDGYGNRVKQVVCPGTVPASNCDEYATGARMTQTDYTANAPETVNGQFATSITNDLGHDETRVYDPRFGALKRQTGLNNLTTTWLYDGFGRKTQEDRIDGTQTTIDYFFCSTCPTVGQSIALYQVTTQSTASAAVTEYFDALQRSIRKQGVSFSGDTVYTDTQYDDWGRIKNVSEPYYLGEAVHLSLYSYDVLDRVISLIPPHSTSNSVTTNHNEYTTTTTDLKGRQRVEVKNAVGQVESVTEAANMPEATITEYTYDPHGKLIKVEINNDLSSIVNIDYDIIGRKTAMQDPDMGNWSYSYNSFGELVSQTDAKLQTVTMQYDDLGRMTSRTESEGVSTWTYYDLTAPVGSRGKLQRMQGVLGNAQEYFYDSLGRLDKTSYYIDTQTFDVTNTYEPVSGRLYTITYPKLHPTDPEGSRYAVRRVFNANGYLERVETTEGTPFVIWRANETNARGQLTDLFLGNGTTEVRVYDSATGWLKSKQAWDVAYDTLQSMDYDYDDVGNLNYRKDLRQSGLQEDFTYDNLDRLTSAQITGQTQYTYTYDSLGNIATKSDVGTYTYGTCGAGPHAVCSAGGINYNYDANGNSTSGDGRTVSYTSYNKPYQIIKNNDKVSFTYGANRSRFLRVLRDAITDNEISRTIYVGLGSQGNPLFEKHSDTQSGDTTFMHYIYAAGAQSVASFKVKETTSSTTTSMDYYHRDHLGSVEVVTNDGGLVAGAIYKSYDAWGKERDPNWGGSQTVFTPYDGRLSFTGHEAIPEVDLIHMNGRVYDPKLGRFLSADPNVQFEKQSASYNRYTYVNNNPLKSTDPSGYFLRKLLKKISPKLAAAIATALNFIPGIGNILSAVFSAMYAKVNGASNSQVATSFLVGMISGKVGKSGAGKIVTDTKSLQFAMVQGAISGATSGGINAMINDTKLSRGILQGMSSGAATGALMWGIEKSVSSRTTQGTNGQQDINQATKKGSGVGTCTGNPINIATGEKYLVMIDYKASGSSRLIFSRHYSSYDKGKSALGFGWRHNFERRLLIQKRATNNKKVFVSAIRHVGEPIVFEQLTKKGKSKFSYKEFESLKNAKLEKIENGWVLMLADDSREYYNEKGILQRIESLDGYIQFLSYNKKYKLKKVEDNFGQKLTFRYSHKGFLSSIKTTDGSVTRFVQSKHGLLAKAVSPDKSYQKYHYDNLKYKTAITRITDHTGSQIHTMAYDRQGRAILSELGEGAERTTIQFQQERVATVTNSLGKQTTYTFDKKNNPLKVEGHATSSCIGANQSYEYNDQNQLINKTDWNGTVTQYKYNKRGLEVLRIEAVGKKYERIIETEWDPRWSLPSSIKTKSLLTTFLYDINGFLIKKTEKDLIHERTLLQKIAKQHPQRSWHYQYNEKGLLTLIDGPRDDVKDITYFNYDWLGNRVEIINALGQSNKVLKFNKRGLPTHLKSLNNVETKLEYNDRGWLVSKTVKGSNGDEKTRIQYTGVSDYTGEGLIKNITLPDDTRLHYEYDAGRRLVSESNDAGEKIVYKLDLEGNRTEITSYSEQGKIVTQQKRVYDELSRLLKIIGADGNTLSMDYDRAGNRRSTIDGLNNKTQYAYDALNRLIATTDANEGIIKQAWDTENRLTQVTDQRGLTTQFQYNGFGQKISQNSPDTGKTVYNYDLAGNLIQKTDARNEKTIYQYDALNRLIKTHYPAAPELDISYSYDGAEANYSTGKLVKVEDNSGQTQYSYNHNGQVIEQIYQIEKNEYKQSYQYDHAGKLQAIQYPSGLWVNYQYNKLGKVSHVNVKGTDDRLMNIAREIDYQPMGSVNKLEYGNGLNLNIQHNKNSRITEITLSHDDGHYLYSTNYKYNDAGNITNIEDQIDQTRNKHYAYDKLHRLISAQGEYGQVEYQYDAVGNRTQRRYHKRPESGLGTINTVVEQYRYEDQSNRLISIESHGQNRSNLRELGYDETGNVIMDKRNNEIRILGYGANNRLGHIEINKETELNQAKYRYNAKGQRVIKRINEEITNFHYDINNRLIAETNEKGMPMREYLYGAGQRLAILDYTSGLAEVQYVINDHLGTPQMQIDQNQRVTWVNNERPFGEVASIGQDNSQNINQPLRFPGQYADFETGYSYNYFRDYDPSLGRYIQSDPIGLMGGVNTFGYVLGNPLVTIDIYGLLGVSPSLSAKYPNAAAFIQRMTVYSQVEYTAYFNYGQASSSAVDAAFSGNTITVNNRSSDYVTNSTGTFMVNGTYLPGTTELGISPGVLSAYENGVNGASILLESTVKHELTHYFDMLDGRKYTGGEAGKEFEKAVYGKDIGRGNASANEKICR